MLLVNAVKTVCDFLLCFSFASLIASYGGAWQLMASVLFLAFLSSLILQKAGGTVPARILCGLLPAFGLFAAHSLAEIVITSIILALYFIMTLNGRNEIHYEDYKYWFGIPAVPVMMLFVICIGKWPVRPTAVICAAAYLFLGVLVLRRKRMGAGAGAKLRLVNLAELIGVVVFTVLACILLYTAVRHASKIVEALMLPFGYLISALVALLDWFIKKVQSDMPPEMPLPQETETAGRETASFPETIPTDLRDDTVFSQADMWIKIILIILALALLAYLLYRFYRMLRNVRTEGTGAAATTEEGEEELFRSRRLREKRKKLSGPSNNDRIRMIYKDYLFYVKTCGVEITRQTTSADVLEASGRLPAPAEAERLRALYIRARYRHSEEMSDAEVDEAKTLLASIREQIEAMKTSRWAAEHGVKAI